jgi:hypothetical protein
MISEWGIMLWLTFLCIFLSLCAAAFKFGDHLSKLVALTLDCLCAGGHSYIRENLPWPAKVATVLGIAVPSVTSLVSPMYGSGVVISRNTLAGEWVTLAFHLMV